MGCVVFISKVWLFIQQYILLYLFVVLMRNEKREMPEGSPNPPTQLVSITLNIVTHKQKTELAGELMRREEKT